MNWLEYITYRSFIKPFSAPWQWPTDWEQPGDWEAIRFDRPTGGMLAGLYGPANSTPKGTVVCAHPTHKTAKGFFLKYGHARMLREAGYNVLLFDFGGSGESSLHDFHFPTDVLTAGKEAQRRARDLPVALYGICSGAVWGLCACAHTDHPFTAAVFESPFTGWLDYYRRPFEKNRRLKSIFRQNLAMILIQLWKKHYPEKAPPFQAIDHARQLRYLEELLFIYGTEDTFTPPRMGRQFANASSVPADLWEVPGGKHLRVPVVDPEAYRARVTGCFDRAFTRCTWQARRTIDMSGASTCQKR